MKIRSTWIKNKSSNIYTIEKISSKNCIVSKETNDVIIVEKVQDIDCSFPFLIHAMHSSKSTSIINYIHRYIQKSYSIYAYAFILF